MPASTTIRIALCLNGGVSLAVWMSGVVHELDLICRASRDRKIRPPAGNPLSAAGAENDHFRQWQQFCAERNIEVEVDIIAGTSAGGLNGAFLAKAVACGSELPDLRTLWADEAALAPGKVLWDGGDSALKSLLNGEHLAQLIKQQLDAECPQPVQSSPMTLFLTATALGSSNRRFIDAAGGSFDVPDHRRLYRFRAGRHLALERAADGASTTGFIKVEENDFAEHGDQLALAARASAGFPVAFTPVPAPPELAQRLHSPRPGDADAATTYLIDGGVLDNAPLGPVLDEIATRRADARISRKLIYLVPSDGVLTRAPMSSGDPSWVQVAAAAVGMPREADFRGDIEQLQGVLRSSRARMTAATAMLDAALDNADRRAELLAGSKAMVELYREARIRGSILDIREELATRAHRVRTLGSSTPENGPAGQVAQWAMPGGDGWQYGISGALRTVRTMLSATRTLIEHAENDAGNLVALSSALSVVSEKIAAVNRAVADTLYESGSPIMMSDPDDKELIDEINRAFDTLDVPTLLDGLIDEAVARYAREHRLQPDVLRTVLEAIEVVTGALAARSEDQTPAPFGFVRLGPDVEHPTFPDSQLHDDKLYGTRLQHFGAFGARRWRLWDWTWGRLDATTHIARLLDAAGAGTAATAAEELDTLVGTLEKQVIVAENKTVDGMREVLGDIAAQLDQKPGKKDLPLLNELRTDERDGGQEALAGLADSMFRFLAQDDETLPRWLRAATGYARAAFEPRWRLRMTPKQHLARLALTRTRRAGWRWLGQ
jgi:predicted acylesterase/phospholipase RssA